MSGYGWHYLLPCYFISHCTFGRRVAWRLMKRSGTSSTCLTSSKGWNTRRGVPHWGCFCKPLWYSLSCKPCSWSYSYPLAYSLTVLPLSIARWSSFNGAHVSSAATFFAVSMYNLSGAINVFLLLAVRPQLLLLIRPDPDELVEPEIELAPQNLRGNGDGRFLEAAKYQLSPGPTTTALAEGSGSGGNSAPVSRVSSKRKNSIDVDV